jgi:hypothetical protein
LLYSEEHCSALILVIVGKLAQTVSQGDVLVSHSTQVFQFLDTGERHTDFFLGASLHNLCYGQNPHTQLDVSV